MSDLGEVLGAVLAGLAHARRIADEESSVIAEYYRDNPLLEGMSLPRVRVPEMVLDLPVLIDSFDEGEPSVPASPQETRSKVQLELQKSVKANGVTLPKTFLDRVDREVQRELNKVQRRKGSRTYTAERTAKAVDRAFLNVVKADSVARFSADQQAAIRADLRAATVATAVKKPGRQPSLAVDVVTADVKDMAAAGNVARLRVTLKEEGLEWTVVEQPDGTVSRTLTPE